MKYKNQLKEWLENTANPTVKSRTYDKYERMIRTLILPSLGERELIEPCGEKPILSILAFRRTAWSATHSYQCKTTLSGRLRW